MVVVEGVRKSTKMTLNINKLTIYIIPFVLGVSVSNAKDVAIAHVIGSADSIIGKIIFVETVSSSFLYLHKNLFIISIFLQTIRNY